MKKVGFAVATPISSPPHGMTAQWRAHWLFALRTPALRGDVRACREALRRVPETSWVVDSELGVWGGKVLPMRFLNCRAR